MKTIRQTASLFFLLLCAGAIAFAQNAAGSLSGTADDPNGGALAGAKITAKQVATGRTFVTITTGERLYSSSERR